MAMSGHEPWVPNTELLEHLDVKDALKEHSTEKVIYMEEVAVEVVDEFLTKMKESL